MISLQKKNFFHHLLFKENVRTAKKKKEKKNYRRKKLITTRSFNGRMKMNQNKIIISSYQPSARNYVLL